jgi:F-type H+-transporting ATPase subunit delta
LAANDRLGVLPEIAKLFDERKVGSENRLNAEVTSAYPMDAAQERVFAQALEKRFGRAVNTTVHVDKNLIGGAIIQIGDVVIDDSLRMRLVRMASELGI